MLSGFLVGGVMIVNSQASHESPHEVYLPLVIQPDPFSVGLPIWAHNNPPEIHEIALFRRTISLGEPLEDSALDIFSDTRYELWIDGTWFGRGPARFSRRLREYDRYSLNTLQPGEHLIAVLVQWSPNSRRSESGSPYLQAVLSGRSADGSKKTYRSDIDWKVLLTDAWRSDAALVHTWGLIGSTELLDLARLPINPSLIRAISVQIFGGVFAPEDFAAAMQPGADALVLEDLPDDRTAVPDSFGGMTN